MTLLVPWNAAWSSELRYEVRPCRWIGMKRAVWQPHSPGVGRPIFAKPHNVRQRMSIAQYICTVCGKPTAKNDRWWFALGSFIEQWFATTEAPVHRQCADLALTVCPHLKKLSGPPLPFPSPDATIAAVVGGSTFDEDFGLRLTAEDHVVGSLKFAWDQQWMADYLRLHGVSIL